MNGTPIASGTKDTIGTAKVKKIKAARYSGTQAAEIFERDMPVIAAHQVLVKMRACGICQFDIKCFSGKMNQPQYCSAPGHEGVGIVEAVGGAVTDIKAGDKVTCMYLGGAMAEYFAADRAAIAKIPQEVQDFERWIAEPGACVVNALRLLQIEPGDSVVVQGSGYMGLLIIQGLPKEFIDTLVAIDLHESRLELAKKYGADVVINAQKEDEAQTVLDSLKGEADVVIEATGLPGVLARSTKMVRSGGKLCIFGHHHEDEVLPMDEWHMKGLTVLNTTPFSSKNFQKDLIDAVTLLRKKVFDQSELISRVYEFRDIKRALQEVSRQPADIIKAVLINT